MHLIWQPLQELIFFDFLQIFLLFSIYFWLIIKVLDDYISVTDLGTRVCMDFGGNGAIMNVGGEGGTGPPRRGRDEQLVPGSGDG